MLWWLHFAFLAAASKGAQGQARLVESGGGAANTGGSRRLSCTGSGFAFSSYTMFWYRQAPGKGLEWVSWISSSGGSTDYTNAVKGRFTVTRDNAKNQLSLQMSRLGPEDTARYFCAARDTCVNTLPLIFGKGTQLRVEQENPEHSPPSVFVVKSEKPKPSDGNKLTAACLVKDFYPKNVQVSMSQEKDLVYKSKEGILSSNGKYSMIQVVKVEPNEEVDCYVTHEGKTYNQTKAQSAPTPAPINNTQVCESSNSTVEEPNMEKVNMLSVTVLGLRVLLAKSIAFNMLMTVKLFIF
ncbi:immunoglobulin gamma-1 heavy chain-like isoform X3 [Gopherus flavomarginatus]|uniref:immunoglobulin gamma-1 heavy chain-like isoform X3 n=1 Tax=Gopherus flavomarginatus TaxID=286002 RepID=UPI0021CBD0F8|nr:immunoglobulin gamma-1 heavy chain-like isoform X3 [Gopherus flavomarginatus]